MTLAFARFDLRSWLPRTQTLLPLVLVVAAGIAVPVPGMAIVAAGLVTSLMVSAPFLADERSGLDTLHGLLPVTRSAVVAGRALALVAYALVAGLLATATTLAVVAVRGSAVDASIVVVLAAATAAFVGLAMAIQLPVLFAIGYARGRLVAYAPAFVVAGLAWLGQALGLIGGGTTPSLPIAPIVGVCAVLAVVGIVLGVALAMRAYRAREIR